MGVQSVTGSAPYWHVFQMADVPPPPLTIWDMVADDWYMFTDCYVASLTLHGEMGNVCTVQLGLIALGSQRVDPPVITPLPDDPRFKSQAWSVPPASTAAISRLLFSGGSLMRPGGRPRPPPVPPGPGAWGVRDGPGGGGGVARDWAAAPIPSPTEGPPPGSRGS